METVNSTDNWKKELAKQKEVSARTLKQKQLGEVKEHKTRVPTVI